MQIGREKAVGNRIILHKFEKYSIIEAWFWKSGLKPYTTEGTYYMDLRIAITDDLNSEREKLSSAIVVPFEKVGIGIGNIDEYTSGESLLKQFSAGKYDLIFLDIYMGGMSGVETAKRIRAIDKNVMLVFVTTSNEFASESYAVKANFYLLKPIRSDMIKQLAETIAQQMQSINNIVVLPDSTVIPLSSLVYTSCSGHYVNVYLVGCEPLKIRTTHKIMEETLAKYDGIIPCNKGVLVSLANVARLDGENFYMINGDTVPISRRKMTQIKNDYTRFVLNRIHGEFEKDQRC